MSGEYYFRTIKQVAYRGRPAPHIHFKVKAKGHRPWTTQLFIKGDPGNRRDGIFCRIGSEIEVSTVTSVFSPVKKSVIGELEAKFDIVLGYTKGDSL